MKPFILLLATKIISLIGALFNTVGFLTFFIWESLEPYRWSLIIGGLVLIGVAEVTGHLLTKRLAREAEEDWEEAESLPD